MTLQDQLNRVFEFHRWRVMGACDALESLSVEQLDAPLGGSFVTVRALVQHLVWVDRLWLARVQQQPNPPIAPVEALPWPELLSSWRQQALAWQALVAPLSPEQLTEPVRYRSAAANLATHPGFEHPLADLLFQAQDHTGYHLGQLAHAMRQLGLTPPALGYAAWLWRAG